MPTIVRDALHRRRDHMGGYHGHVADVDINPWRGACSLNDLIVVKTSGKVPLPLPDTRSMDIALSWNALWHGAIRATVDFRHPVRNFVDSSGQAGSQAGRGVDWRKQLEHLQPAPKKNG